MKRRQLLLATASLSLAGASGLSNAAADSSAQSDPIGIQNATVDLGGATVTIGSATLAHDGDTLVFEGADWTATAGNETVSLGGAQVTVGNVDDETYAQIQNAMIQSVRGRSLSPLLSGLQTVDVDPSAPVEVWAGPISSDRGPIVDEIYATGNVGGVVPENWGDWVAGGSQADVGSMQFDAVTVHRGSVAMTAENVVAQPFENALSVTADGGTVEAPSRTLEFQNLNTTFRPPEEGGEEQGRALDGLQQLAANESLTVDAISTTLMESGVTVSNTMEALRNTRFEASVESVTENGQALVQNFSTSGTLSELSQLLKQRT